MPETSPFEPVQGGIELSESKSLWEDSSLVRQWDDAVEEYQKYHSLEARGVRTLDDLKQEEAIATENVDHDKNSNVNIELGHSISNEAHEESDPAITDAEDEDEEAQGSQSSVTIQDKNMHVAKENKTSNFGISLEGFDEGTKSLIMAWYWAGYYQGLELGKKMGQK